MVPERERELWVVISGFMRAEAFREGMLPGLVILSLLSVHLCLRDPWAAEERVSGCVVVGDRSSTCLRHTFVRGVRSESASYACYLPECLRAGQNLLCVHDNFSVPLIRLSVSRHACGLLRCVSSALHFSSVGASVHSSVSARAVPAKLSFKWGHNQRC